MRRPPKVAIIPTGTELVVVGTAAAPGQIVESNSLMLAAMVDDWGAEATRRQLVADDLDQLKAAVLDARSGLRYRGGERRLVCQGPRTIPRKRSRNSASSSYMVLPSGPDTRWY